MKRIIQIWVLLVLIIQYNQAQVLLDADGVSDTYDLINSVLAPGYNVVEAPGIMVGECDNHSAFGDHITQVFDNELGIYVFAFHIHVDSFLDNDRCKNFDRQRCEIKTYDKSPDNLLGVLGETVEFKWKFKLDEGFQPSSSFTHIHQLKSVGSPEDSMPLLTLTPRKGSPDKLQIRYSAKTSQSTIHEVPLDPFKGVWAEVTEKITYGEAGYGKYDITIEKVSDGTLLLDYSTSTLRMWKTNAWFIRPKWGIYRSLNDATNLRDEIVYFANFSIEELADIIDPQVALSTQTTELNVPSFDISIVFSEPVSGFSENDITVTNGTVEPGSLSGSGNKNFSATILPDFNGAITIEIGADAAQDAAGNGNITSNQLTINEDTTAPEATIELAEGVITPVTEEFGVVITFNEYITGFEAGDIIVENGSVLGNPTSTDNQSYAASIQPSSADPVDVIVRVNAGAAQDLSGNPNDAAIPLMVPYSGTSAVYLSYDRHISLYPNPVDEMFWVDLGNEQREFDLRVVDQLGRIVLNKKLNGRIISIDASAFEKGIYTIQIHTNEGVFSTRFIK